MTIFSNTREIEDRFGDYIEELRAILTANNIKFGSPDNFFEFARRLQSDDLLPGDLSRMIESIVDRESDKVSPKMILTIIAIAVGGSTVSEPDHNLSKSVNLVVDFLIRSGNCSPTDPDYLETMCMAPFTVAANLEKDISLEETHSSFHIELPPNDPPSDQIDNTRWASSTSDALPLRLSDDSTKLIQSLARLELNAAHAKVYLDSIEQWISRMEPRLENIPSLVTPPPTHSQTPAIKPLPSTDSLVEPPPVPSDLPLPNFVRQASPQTKEHLAWSFVLGKKLAAAPPLLATIAGGTLLYIGYQRGSVETGIPQAIPGAAATINQPSDTAAITSVSQPQYALTVVATEDDVKPQPTKPSAGLLKPNSHTSKTIQDRTPHRPLESAAEHMPQHPVVDANDEAAEAPQPRDSTEAVARKDVRFIPTHASVKSTSPSPRIINVSSGVMADNLLSATPPPYPKLASLTHMQGKVVMQAIISKDGTVQNLQVIQGHRLLRGAAKNSARTWRYRPYMVNGKPVEVATIVSIDFNLGH